MWYVPAVGVLGLTAIAMCWALAVVLYRVAPKGSTARKLAVLLVIEGLTLFTAGFPEFVMGMEWANHYQEIYPTLGLASFLFHHLSDGAMIALYPPFLAAALATGFTARFARKGARITLAIIGLVLALSTVVTATLWESHVGSAALYIAVMLLFVIALIASIDAYRKAKPGLAKTRAGVFASAFGIRDACWGFTYGASFWMITTGMMDPSFVMFWITKVIYALGTLFAVPLIAYGVLRAHLFDIDLRIRWTIKQSTLAALIVAIVFLISEGVSTFLSAEFGTVAGLFAAAVVIFFLTPLQQFAERIASSAMPNTKNTPEYLAFRKMQVYEVALVDALSEGGISDKERLLLGHLRDSLGITAADAQAIELELRAGNGRELAPAIA
jgi:hypothetical protein